MRIAARLMVALALAFWAAAPLTRAAETARAPTNAAQPRRFALVIGNSDYPTAPLRNPVNDAAAILNDRLSELRAQRVKNMLDADAPQIRGKTSSRGVGSSELMVGAGKDDESDALDRRVEFKLTPSC